MHAPARASWLGAAQLVQYVVVPEQVPHDLSQAVGIVSAGSRKKKSRRRTNTA